MCGLMLVLDWHLHFRVSHLKELLRGHVCLHMISINSSVLSENPEGRISSNMMPHHLLPDVIHHPCHVGGPRGLTSQDGDHVATLDRPGNNVNLNLALIEHTIIQ